MMFRNVLMYSVALAIAAASSTVVAETIQWQPCTEAAFRNSTPPLSCANLTVPLDYTTANSNATVDLQLLKVSATNGPSNGSIILNFGGPGEPDRDNLAQLASYLLVYVMSCTYAIVAGPVAMLTLTFQCNRREP